MKSTSAFGIVGDDFVMIVAGVCQIKKAIVFKSVTDMIRVVNSSMMMACAGNLSSVTRFCDYVQRRCRLYEFQNSYRLSAQATATFASGYIAECNRSVNPFDCHSLLAGWEKDVPPAIYFIDSFGGMVKCLTFATQGLEGLMAISILDKLWHPNLSQEAAYEIMEKCVETIQGRFAFNRPVFSVKVVDATGVRDLPRISVEDLSVKKTLSRPDLESTL